MRLPLHLQELIADTYDMEVSVIDDQSKAHTSLPEKCRSPHRSKSSESLPPRFTEPKRSTPRTQSDTVASLRATGQPKSRWSAKETCCASPLKMPSRGTSTDLSHQQTLHSLVWSKASRERLSKSASSPTHPFFASAPSTSKNDRSSSLVDVLTMVLEDDLPQVSAVAPQQNQPVRPPATRWAV